MNDLVTAMKQRSTEKVLADTQNPLPITAGHRDAIDDMLASASWAPFHFPNDKSHRTELNSPVPWRFYKVDAASCRVLMQELQAPDAGAGKITAMLAAADSLIQVTWLPDPPADPTLAIGSAFEGSQRNMEHIAAASSAAYGLLLLATQRGYKTYWSSGGVLRNTETFERLGIPTCEKLLGSVFLFPQEVGNADIKPGSWRDKRGEISDWSAWRDLAS